MKNFYQILNVQEDATEEELKRAYYSLMRQWHPDKNLDKHAEATEKAKEIAEAYSELKDPETRERYDAALQRERSNADEETFASGSSSSSSSSASSSGYKSSFSDEKFQQALAEVFKLITDELERRDLLGDQLVEAAYEGKWHIVTDLISQGANLSNSLSPAICQRLNIAPDWLGYTALHIALSEQPNVSFDRIKFLVNQGSDPNQQTSAGMAPLHFAARRGELEVVKFLREKGAYPHYLTGKGSSPLHLAIREKHFNVAIYLIENPSDTRNPFNKESSNMRKNAQGKTPLEMAAEVAIEDAATSLFRIFFYSTERTRAWEVVSTLLARPEINFSSIDYLNLSTMALNKAVAIPKAIDELIQELEAQKNRSGCLVM